MWGGGRAYCINPSGHKSNCHHWSCPVLNKSPLLHREIKKKQQQRTEMAQKHLHPHQGGLIGRRRQKDAVMSSQPLASLQLWRAPWSLFCCLCPAELWDHSLQIRSQRGSCIIDWLSGNRSSHVEKMVTSRATYIIFISVNLWSASKKLQRNTYWMIRTHFGAAFHSNSIQFKPNRNYPFT